MQKNDDSSIYSQQNISNKNCIYQTYLLWRIEMTLTFLRLNFFFRLSLTHCKIYTQTHIHARAHVSHTNTRLHHKLFGRFSDGSNVIDENCAQWQHHQFAARFLNRIWCDI